MRGEGPSSGASEELCPTVPGLSCRTLLDARRWDLAESSLTKTNIRMEVDESLYPDLRPLSRQAGRGAGFELGKCREPALARVRQNG